MESEPKRLKPQEALRLLEQISKDYFSFGRLNMDVLWHIMFNSGLTFKDIDNLCRAAPSFQDFCTDDAIWERVFLKQFGARIEEEQKLLRESYALTSKRIAEDMEQARLSNDTEWLNELQVEKEELYNPKNRDFLADYTRWWREWRRTHLSGPLCIMTFAYCYDMRIYTIRLIELHMGDKARRRRDPNSMSFEKNDAQIELDSYFVDNVGDMRKDVLQIFWTPPEGSKESIVKWLPRTRNIRLTLEQDFNSDDYSVYEVEYAFQFIYILLSDGWVLSAHLRGDFPGIQSCLSCIKLGSALTFYTCGGPCRGGLAIYCGQECADKHYVKHKKVCQ